MFDCRSIVTALMLAILPSAVLAQAEADWAMMLEINEAKSLANDEETTRQAYDACKAIAAKLAERSDVLGEQRLYFEASLSRCYAHAMVNGKFADAEGGYCFHEYAGSSKFAKVIEMLKDRPEHAEFRQLVQENLSSAIGMSSNFNCTEDFEALRAE